MDKHENFSRVRGIIITIVLAMGTLFSVLVNVTTYSVYATGADAGTVTSNCPHVMRESIAGPCTAKITSPPGNTSQMEVVNASRASIATLNITGPAILDIGPQPPIPPKPFPTNGAPTNNSILANKVVTILNSTQDVLEVACDYDLSTLEISRCDVLSIIQIDPETKDRLRIIQNSIGTVNMTAQLPINSITLEPLQ
jgi:hypothetical protein